MLFRASPAQLAAAWRAFRGERKGMLLGPGQGFAEAVGAAMALTPDHALTEAERAAMARAMYAEACRAASCRSSYAFAGSADDRCETPTVWFDRLDAAMGALGAARANRGQQEESAHAG